MLQPQEVVVAKLLPTLRARVAQILLQDYALKQVQVAKLLGITQPAVSHYNTKSRGIDREILRLFPEVEGHAQLLALRIRQGLSQTDQIGALAAICENVLRTERFCSYHKRLADIDPTCDICFPGHGMPAK